VLDLPKDPNYVGAEYYSQFPKAVEAGWNDPNFMPIAVWLSKPAHAAQLAAVGVNTYIGVEHDGSALTDITSKGSYVIPQSEWTTAEVGGNSHAPGWLVSDECDMGLDGCSDADLNGDRVIDEYDNVIAQQRKLAAINARNTGMFNHVNFGNGVLRTFWATHTMDQQVQMMDGTGVDKYAYTSPDTRELLKFSDDWPAGANPKSAAAYGWLQDQMERFMAPGGPQPNFIDVETAMPLLGDTGAGTITPDQITGAVWSSLIHGAYSVMYFQHNNNGCGFYSLVQCSQTLKDRVKALNAEVTGFAPVLHTPTYLWDFKANADTMLKVKDGNAYIFSGVGLNQTAGSKTFTLPAGVTGSSVEVVGENRTLQVTGGKFTDSFAAEWTHHVYKIAV
jgi:hypothetical protein